MRKNIFLYSMLLLSTQIFLSCNSAVPIEKIIVEENKSWNEDDSEVIADSVVSKSLLSEWKTEFNSNRKPVIIIGLIKNLTNEEIDSDLLSKNIERSFINDGQVTFISSKAKREEIRTDRKNSIDFADNKDFTKYLKASKADFFLDGTFNLTVDSLSKPIVKEYNLLINIINAKKFDVVSSKKVFLVK